MLKFIKNLSEKTKGKCIAKSQHAIGKTGVQVSFLLVKYPKIGRKITTFFIISQYLREKSYGVMKG